MGEREKTATGVYVTLLRNVRAGDKAEAARRGRTRVGGETNSRDMFWAVEERFERGRWDSRSRRSPGRVGKRRRLDRAVVQVGGYSPLRPPPPRRPRLRLGTEPPLALRGVDAGAVIVLGPGHVVDALARLADVPLCSKACTKRRADGAPHARPTQESDHRREDPDRAEGGRSREAAQAPRSAEVPSSGPPRVARAAPRRASSSRPPPSALASPPRDSSCPMCPAARRSANAPNSGSAGALRRMDCRQPQPSSGTLQRGPAIRIIGRGPRSANDQEDYG